jgi:hypothetical protein
MVNTIQIKRGTRAQIEAAKAAGQLRDGEPYLITDEDRLAVGVTPNGYSSFAKLEELQDEKVAVTDAGQPGYLWGNNNTGLIRTDPSLTLEKDTNNSYIQLAVGDVDFGTF